MIVSAGVLLAPAGALAAGITVRLTGAVRHLSPDQIDAAVDRPAGSYLLRAPNTAAEPVGHPPALSMRNLVSLAGASPDSVSFVTIGRPNGSLAVLRRGDLADPAPFLDGPPIVWMDSGSARYLRPLRSRSDVNATDNVGVTEGNLEVRVHNGRLLSVSAQASRSQVPAGRPVSLSANVTGARRGEELSFEWTFGDGTGAPGRTVRHRFRTPGVYEAVVAVNGAADSGGSSSPLRISVGEPQAKPGDTGGGTGSRRTSPAQGPAGPAGGSGAGAPSSEAPAPAPSRPGAGTPTRSRRQPSPAAPRVGEAVRGTLVAASSVTAVPGASAAARDGLQAAARRGSDPSSSAFGGWLGGILSAGLLVWLGVRRERRQLRARPEPAR